MDECRAWGGLRRSEDAAEGDKPCDLFSSRSADAQLTHAIVGPSRPGLCWI